MLNSPLTVCNQDAAPGALDAVMEDVLEVIEAEVWGDIGEEKEAGAFAGGCKEAKRARGVDSYQLLAQGVTFRTHIGPLLQPVRAFAKQLMFCPFSEFV